MTIFNKLWNTFVLKYKKVCIGRGCDIRGRIYVHGVGRLEIVQG